MEQSPSESHVGPAEEKSGVNGHSGNHHIKPPYNNNNNKTGRWSGILFVLVMHVELLIFNSYPKYFKAMWR